MERATRSGLLWMRTRLAFLILAAINGGVLGAGETTVDWLGNYWPLVAALWLLASFTLFSLVIWIVTVLNRAGGNPWPRPSMRSSIFRSPVEFFAFAALCGLAAGTGGTVASLIAHARIDTLILSSMGGSAGALAASWAMWRCRHRFLE